MMPDISVIIPFYNVSEYMESCARSLFSQTMPNIEYIFVNDCSTDDSKDILLRTIEDFPERADMVHILTTPTNLGCSRTRQYGVDIATGKYIIFCDADDYLEPYAYEHLFAEVSKYNADGIRCEYYRAKEGKNIKSQLLINVGRGQNCRNELLDCIVRAYGLQSLWIYMFKTSLYRDFPIKFTEYNQGEDIELITQLVYYSKSIVYLGEHLYFWRYNSNSITNGKTLEKSFKRFHESNANTDMMIEFLRSKGLESGFSKHIVALKRYSKSTLSEAMKLGEGLQEWKNTYPEINAKVYTNPYISLRHKVQYFVTILRCDIPLAETIYQLVTGHRKNAGRSSQQ